MATDSSLNRLNSTVKKKVPIATIFQNERFKFPFVANVYNTERLTVTGVDIRDGELLWFLSKSSVESITCCTWTNTKNIFTIDVNSGIQISLRDFHIVSRSRFSNSTTGPSMDIHTLVSLVKPEQPIFAVPVDSEMSNYPFLRKENGQGWRGRILIHEREEMIGFLAKGATNMLVIPSDFDQEFLFDNLPKEERTTFKTVADIYNSRCQDKILATGVNASNNGYSVDTVDDGDILELHRGGQTEFRRDNFTGEEVEVVVFKRRKKHRTKADIIHVPLLTRGTFECIQKQCYSLPVYASRAEFPAEKVQYIDACLDARRPLDHTILQEESPLTIFGLACFSVTHISLHLNNPSCPSFQATQSIPDYYKCDVTPASEIPLDPIHFQNFVKPKQTVQVLTAKQFEELRERIENSYEIPNMMKGTDLQNAMVNEPSSEITHLETPSEELEPAYEDTQALDAVSQSINGSHLHPQINQADYGNDEDPLYEDNYNVIKDDSEEDSSDYMNVPAEASEQVRTPPIASVAVNPPAPRQPRPMPRIRTPKRNNEISGTNNNEITDLRNHQQSNNLAANRLPPPQASKPKQKPPKPPQRNAETSITVGGVEEAPKLDGHVYHPERVVTPSLGYINTPRSSIDDLYDEVDAPPPMPPKQPHTRRSVDFSGSDVTSFENAPKQMTSLLPPQNTDSPHPNSPAVTQSTRNNQPNHNQKVKGPPPVASKKPPPKKPKPNKLPLPTTPKPNKPNKPSNIAVPSTEPSNVSNLKHQISQKLREEKDRKGLTTIEQNNNEPQLETPQINVRPTASPRKPPSKPLPSPGKQLGVPIAGGVPMFGFGPPAGGVAIFPVMSPQRPPVARPTTQQVAPRQLPGKPMSLPPQIPSQLPGARAMPPQVTPGARTGPVRPARAAPVPPPGVYLPPQPPPKPVVAFSDSSASDDEGNDYQAISDDEENDYEFLNEFESTRSPSSGNLAPTLPPMATHPLITGRAVSRQRDVQIIDHYEI